MGLVTTLYTASRSCRIRSLQGRRYRGSIALSSGRPHFSILPVRGKSLNRAQRKLWKFDIETSDSFCNSLFDDFIFGEIVQY